MLVRLFMSCSFKDGEGFAGEVLAKFFYKIQPPLFAFLSLFPRLLICSELQKAKYYPIILKSYISIKITLDFLSKIDDIFDRKLICHV